MLRRPEAQGGITQPFTFEIAIILPHRLLSRYCEFPSESLGSILLNTEFEGNSSRSQVEEPGVDLWPRNVSANGQGNTVRTVRVLR